MAIKKNQFVSLRYELKINDDIVETNLDGDPIEFTFGTGELIPGLEDGIKDMNEGEEKEIIVPASEAYGEYQEELTETLPISEFEGINLQIGLVLEGEDENGKLFKATVTDVTKDSVTMDYNHPLAGCILNFKVVINKIV
jgi:FKBP-type peptidyl-prolyl cis-trans isomerase SlyD